MRGHVLYIAMPTSYKYNSCKFNSCHLKELTDNAKVLIFDSCKDNSEQKCSVVSRWLELSTICVAGFPMIVVPLRGFHSSKRFTACWRVVIMDLISPH